MKRIGNTVVLRKLILGLMLFLWTACPLQSQIISISQARTATNNSIVTVEGVIQNAQNALNYRFLNDGTDGIVITEDNVSFNQSIRSGDRIRVTGRIQKSSSSISLDEVEAFQLLATGLDIADTIAVTDLSVQNDAVRVHLSCVKDLGAGEDEVWDAGLTMIEWNSMTISLYSQVNTPYFGLPRQAVSLNMIGLIYFSPSGPIFLAENIWPAEGCLFWRKPPLLQFADHDQLVYDLALNEDASLISVVRSPTQGIDSFYYTYTGDTQFIIGALAPAERYEVEWIASNGITSLRRSSPPIYTQSSSSREVHVYFNNSVKDSISTNLSFSTTGQETEDAIVKRINEAKEEINLALFNFNNDRIRTALDIAHERGVLIRAIVDADNANIGFRNEPSFSVFYTADNSPLMHHKFMVIDPNVADQAWLFMGATNLTRNQVFVDPNSSVGFQDQMLARLYMEEFYEIWGGQGAMFDLSQAVHGDEKEDNTPHFLYYNFDTIQSYFSPSDGTTDAIVKMISSAKESIHFSLLTFTQNEIREAILKAHRRGVLVQGIIENIDDNGGEFYRLEANGIDVLADDRPRSNHHKYAIIDANGRYPKVIFGSHNWTQKAEDTNDENTLIWHNSDIALLFYQEFIARYCELEARAMACVSSAEKDIASHFSIVPNPALSHQIGIRYNGLGQKDLELTVNNMQGRQVGQYHIHSLGSGAIQILPPLTIASGMYILYIKVDGYTFSKKVILIE